MSGFESYQRAQAARDLELSQQAEAASDIKSQEMVIAYDWDDYEFNRPFLFRVNAITPYQGKTVYHLVCLKTKKYSSGVAGWTVTKLRSDLTRLADFEAKTTKKR